MFDIERKENNQPHLHAGRAFAEEYNSFVNELRNTILPFKPLTAANEYQLVTAIKGITWYQGKSEMTITDNAGEYNLKTGIPLAEGQDIDLVDGMTFTFTMVEDISGTVKIGIENGDKYPVKRGGDDLPDGTFKFGIDYTISFNAGSWVLRETYGEYLARIAGGSVNTDSYADINGSDTTTFKVADAILDKDAVNLGQLNGILNSTDLTVPSSSHTHSNAAPSNARITDERFDTDTDVTLDYESIDFIKIGSVATGVMKLRISGFALDFPIDSGITFTYDYRDALHAALDDNTYSDLSTKILSANGKFISEYGGDNQSSENTAADAWAIGGGKVRWYADTVVGLTGQSSTNTLYQATKAEFTIAFTMQLNKD